ncbi:MAG: cyclic nucleotide-binding domain-containing protein, partial [Pyrinomonadaceae bacterium]
LHIKQADHEKVMSALADEDRALMSSPNLQLTAEKRLQLETYKHALESYLEELAADGTPDDLLIRELRREYRVTKKEHETVLDELLGGEHGVAARLAEEVATIERSAQTIQILEFNPTPTHDFLAFLLQRRRARSAESLMRALSFALETDEINAMRDALCSGDEAQRGSVVGHLRAHLSPTIAERLFKTQRETALIESSMPTLTDILSARTHSTDPYIRAVALYAMSQRGAVDDATLVRMSQDEHEIVRETATHLRERAGSEKSEAGAHPHLSNVEKMLALRTTPIFSSLAPEGLAELARAGVEDAYAPGQTLCIEGEPGNEVFILLSGDVKILYEDGANQRVVAEERAGGFVGEMSALDPAPRSATVIGGENGVRVLRLNGIAFRNALDANPSIAASVIRTLAQRLRQTHQN